MRTLYIILLLTTSSLLTSCGSVKGQAYVDVNENIDFENGEDLRYRTRFKVGYKIYLGEKHNILKDKRKKKRRIMATKFKPHNMYGKSGIVKKANTMKDHLALKKRGYTHTKKK